MTKRGLMFGDKHSYRDLGLVLAIDGIKDDPPPANESYIDVPFRDGALDITESFGEVTYSQRTPTYEFKIIKSSKSWEEIVRKVAKHLHGKRMKIIYDRDPEVYLIGRAKIDEFASDRKIGTLTISATCDPYKYLKDVTVKSYNVNGSLNVVLNNTQKTVYPKITTSADMRVITSDGSSYAFDVRDDYQTEIKLIAGSNELTIEGTGSITFKYQEMVL